MGNKCVYALRNLLSSKVLSRDAKIQLCMMIIRPIVMYVSQCWPLRKTEQDRLRIFERKVLRKIYGSCFDQHTRVWRKSHNQDLEDLFKRSDIVNEIKRSKLESADHVCRNKTLC